MRIADIIDYFENFAPSCLQEKYDNAGLICGDKNLVLSGVLVCLDSTEDVVQEAINYGFNLIIAHHPIVFEPIKKIVGANYSQRAIIKAIQNNICILAIHTNLDKISKGTNYKIAQKLKLQNLQILLVDQDLDTKTSQIQNLVGHGMFGVLPIALSQPDFLDLLKNTFNLSCIKYTGCTHAMIQTIAVCGGSGSFLTHRAKAVGAHAFVSADFKYHDFFEADNQLMICDIGHYESESCVQELFFEHFSEKFSNIAVKISDINTNPVHYFI